MGRNGVRSLKRGLALTCLLALLMGLAAGCAAPPVQTNPPTTQPAETVAETVPPTCPPDGNPADVTCKGSYTAQEIPGDTPVATLGEASLTNSGLQVYYWLEVARYLRENPGESFSQGLDTLMCPLAEGRTWQQYFLDRALHTWHSHQALVAMAAEAGLPTDPSYQPDSGKHQKLMTEDLPALKYLYGYAHTHFAPNDMHQAYLDALPGTLENLALEIGYESLSALTLDLAGPGAAEADLLEFARLYNWAYSYFTSLTYYQASTAEEVEAFFAQREEAYRENGITRESGDTVELRHILLIPENASIADDGTVTCAQESWDACLEQAQELYDRCARLDDADFAEVAYAQSRDDGSNLNGGLYSGIVKGQLTEVLDAWCFDPARKSGDTEILRTGCGYHIVRFRDSQPIWYAQAEKDLRSQWADGLLQSAMETYPMTVSYGDISLGLAAQSGACVAEEELLYPDVAHERFPTAPVYLQQDYPNTWYGNYPIVTHGCGITTMAMLATYMTDEEWTPPELCARYGRYCSNEGTNSAIFADAPGELGFFLEREVDRDWETVWEALESGRVVTNLQYKGYWTRGGHFLLMEDITEEDTVVVRDSNIYNYGNLPAHKQDAHAKKSLTACGSHCWIYQPKVTRIPACIRCGGGAGHVPGVMFAQDYYCAKCVAAMARREDFLHACQAVK